MAKGGGKIKGALKRLRCASLDGDDDVDRDTQQPNPPAKCAKTQYHTQVASSVLGSHIAKEAAPTPRELQGRPQTGLKAGTFDTVNHLKLYSGILDADSRKFDGNYSHQSDRKMAAIIANVVANKRSRTTSLLPFFVDGSASHDENNAAALPLAAAGYSVVYPQALSGQWVTSAWSCLAYDNNQPEILAVLEALNIAKVLRQGKSMWSHTEPLEVHIFTDSHAAVTYIQKGLNLEVTDLFAALVQPAISAIIRLSHELSAIGVAVWLRNIPGHKHQVVPHQLADTTSRKVAFSGINRCEVDAGGPPYVPIGSSIQRQALQIAKRHPWLDDEGTSGSSKSANATFRTQVTNGHIITCPPVTKDQGSGQNMPKNATLINNLASPASTLTVVDQPDRTDKTATGYSQIATKSILTTELPAPTTKASVTVTATVASTAAGAKATPPRLVTVKRAYNTTAGTFKNATVKEQKNGTDKGVAVNVVVTSQIAAKDDKSANVKGPVVEQRPKKKVKYNSTRVKDVKRIANPPKDANSKKSKKEMQSLCRSFAKLALV